MRFRVCFQSVKTTIYRRMERCGRRALNFSNISEDELDRNVTEAAKDFPFYGEQMLKFLHKERGIKGVSRKLISGPQTSDLRPRKLRPRNFIFLILIVYFVNIFVLIVHIVNSSQFLSPNVLWSRNVQRQQPERIATLIFSGLSLSHPSNSENLTRFKIAADTLTNDVCWRIFYLN